jgi:hypothetical protein
MFGELGFSLAERTPGEGEFTRSLVDPWHDADIVMVHASDRVAR